MNRAIRQVIAAIAIAFAAAFLSGGGVHFIAPLANLETKLADIRVAAMQPAMPPSSDIVVIAIDEATLAAFAYRSPVDRGLVADLIEQLEAKGAAAIGVDIIVDQPTEAAKDERLRKVIRSTRTPLAFSFSSAPNVVNAEQLTYMEQFIPEDKRAEANLLTDPYDGLVRRINPGGTVLNGRRVDTPQNPAGFVRKLAAMRGATAPLFPVDIAWRAQPDAENAPFPTFSATHLSFLPAELIKGKIVLIGAVLSITDRHRTPLSIIDDGDRGNMPGVMIQAHGITQMLEGRRPPTVPLSWSIGLLALFSTIGTVLSLLRMGIVFNVSISFVITIGYWVGAILGFGEGLPMLPLFGPTLALLLALWMMDLIIGRGERKQREFIQSTFSRYVSPAVVDQLIADPSAAQVSGSKREATFIFTDIAGFTTLSEKLEAEELSEVLNQYLDGACEIILKHAGTIDKFIGDAIMAIFNAPIAQADHAARGIRCALELDAYAEAFRKDCNARDIPIGVTRIGIHCGLSIIGNFGSQSRMDFTALGDTVNTAARTEGVNKYFGTRVCCTQQVVDQCPDLEFRPIGDIVLKGKVQATRLYTPIAASDAPELIAGYRRAYALLEASDPEAVDCLASLSKDCPEDPVIRFHQDRIAQGLLSSHVVMDDK